MRSRIRLEDGTELTVRLAAEDLRELVERAAVGRVGVETVERGFCFVAVADIVAVEVLPDDN